MAERIDAQKNAIRAAKLEQTLTEVGRRAGNVGELDRQKHSFCITLGAATEGETNIIRTAGRQGASQPLRLTKAGGKLSLKWPWDTQSTSRLPM